MEPTTPRRDEGPAAPRGRFSLRHALFGRLGLLRRVLRVTALALFLGAIGLGIAVHGAYAEVKTALGSLGESMLSVNGEVDPGKAARVIALNGAVLHMDTGTTAYEPSQVLDFYERRCRARDGRFAQGLDELRAGGQEIPPLDARRLDSTLREESGGKGYVACFDMGPDPIGVAELTRRLSEVARTGDLGALGRFRYLYARRGPTRTRFVAFWTDGELNLRQMFPAEGDAPGEDPAGVPRPPRSVRRLTSFESGEPQRLFVYDSAVSPEDLERHYRELLPSAGWALLEGKTPAGLPEGLRTIVAERGPAEMAVLVFDQGEGKGTALTVLLAR